MISLNYLFESNLKGYKKTVKSLRDPIIQHILYIIVTSKTTIRREYWKTDLYKILLPAINKNIATTKDDKLSKEGYLKEFDLNKILDEDYKTKIIYFTKRAIKHNKDIKSLLFENISKLPVREIQENLLVFFDELSTHLANENLTRDVISKMIDNIILKGLFQYIH